MFTTQVKLKAKSRVAEATYELNLELMDNSFKFKPGQYVWLIVTNRAIGDLNSVRKAFSITSSIENNKNISILYRESESDFKTRLREIGTNSNLYIQGPFGSAYSYKDNDNVVMIAGGVGIAPFLSIIRSQSHPVKGCLKLICVNTSPDTTPLVDEIEKLTKKYGVQFINHYGHFESNILPKDIDFKKDIFLVCGPVAMVDAVYNTLKSKGTPPENIKFEQNYPTPKVKLTEDDFLTIPAEYNIMLQAIQDSRNHVVITDSNGYIVFANKEAERNTGYKYLEMKGGTPRLWGGMMSPDFYKVLWKKIKNVSGFKGDIVNRRRDGSTYNASAHISPIKNKNGIIIGYISTEEDITKQKELDKLKDEFVSVASHELRTPLTAIDSIISMIIDGEYGAINENLKEPLADINISSRRLIYLVNDLLSVSRIQAGTLKYVLSEFHYLKSLKKQVNLLMAIAGKKKIILKLDKCDDCLVQADELKFTEIVMNVIGNAIKFTDKGMVKVKVGKKDDFIEIRVSDTGTGIAKEDIPKVFRKFEQISQNKVKSAGTGTGLGLYISREMARKMGGDVVLARSVYGKGSTFVITVPIAKTVSAKMVRENLK